MIKSFKEYMEQLQLWNEDTPLITSVDLEKTSHDVIYAKIFNAPNGEQIKNNLMAFLRNNPDLGVIVTNDFKYIVGFSPTAQFKNKNIKSVPSDTLEGALKNLDEQNKNFYITKLKTQPPANESLAQRKVA